MRFTLLILYSAISTFSYSQFSIAGIITSKNGGEPIKNCNIYLANTSVGTISNSKGEFILSEIPGGKYDMVVSSVGFEPFIYSFENLSSNIHLKIELSTKEILLENVVVTAKSHETWEKWGDKFKQFFLGTSENSRHTTILNKEVIKFRYSKAQNNLIVLATESIIVLNNNLGYEIYYDLKNFSLNLTNEFFSYSGNAFFKPIAEFPTPAQIKQREKTYYGSLRHFMKSLYANRVKEEGFSVKLLGPKSDIDDILQNRDRVNTIKGSDDLGNFVQGSSEKKKLISWTGYLAVTYNKEYEDAEYVRYSGGNNKHNVPLTILSLVNGRSLIIDEFGNWSPPQNLIVSGYWTWSEKLANMLPLNYEPPKQNIKPIIVQNKKAPDFVHILKNEKTLQEVKVSNNPSRLESARKEIVAKRYTKGIFSVNTANSYDVDVLNDPHAESYTDIFSYIVSKIPGLSLRNGMYEKEILVLRPVFSSSSPSNSKASGTFEIPQPSPVQLFYLNESETSIVMLDQIRLKDIAYIKYFQSFGGKPGFPPAIAIYLKKQGDKGYYEKSGDVKK